MPFRFQFHCSGQFTEVVTAPTYDCAVRVLSDRMVKKGLYISESVAPASCGGTRYLYAYFLNLAKGDYDSVRVECIGEEIPDPATIAARAARYARSGNPRDLPRDNRPLPYQP